MPSSNLILRGQKATVSVAHYETVEKNKKFTVYKVMVNMGGRSWFMFRRYNEFHKLYDLLKKQFPNLAIKFPAKKIFGNNFDPNFIKSRREALDDFLNRLITDENLFNHPDVKIFLNLETDGHVLEDNIADGESCDEIIDEKDDKPVNLGPTEKPLVKPRDFEFLKVIGKGSFGKVLLARSKAEQTIYAVKVLQKRTIIKRNETRHIMAERNVLLKNLHHPFLVGLQYSFQTPDKLYFVLDYVNGGELFFHLQRERRFSEPRSRFYAAEIGSALGYLHSQNIVYRDLKPENILLDSEGHIVLTDFGLCKEGVEGTKTTSTFCGTPEYLAPEVLRKEPYDRCVDWWCLGAVLYEMLFGLPPFYSRDTSEMYDNILNKPLRLRNTIAPCTTSILEGLLEKDKRSRLGSGIKDFEDVKSHEFFKPIRWDDLNNKLIPPPYHPNLSGAMDLKHIDPEFTKEAVPSSLEQSVNGSSHISASIREADNAFLGFSYAPSLEIHK